VLGDCATTPVSTTRSSPCGEGSAHRVGPRLQHLPSHYLAEVDYFFNISKDLRKARSGTLYGWEDRLVAHQVILACIKRYRTSRPV